MQVHKSRVQLVGKTVSDLTRYEKEKVWVPTMHYEGGIIKVPRYPLYEKGTKVRSVKSGNVGTIVETYNHSGDDDGLAHWDVSTKSWKTHKNNDKYGVRFDTSTAHASRHTRKAPINWFKISELEVENPNLKRYQDLRDRAIKAFENREVPPVPVPPGWTFKDGIYTAPDGSFRPRNHFPTVRLLGWTPTGPTSLWRSTRKISTSGVLAIGCSTFPRTRRGNTPSRRLGARSPRFCRKQTCTSCSSTRTSAGLERTRKR